MTAGEWAGDEAAPPPGEVAPAGQAAPEAVTGSDAADTATAAANLEESSGDG